MKYIKIMFTNIEPLRIADDSTSQSGQTASLKYVPGSTMRGLIISRLSSKADFSDIKKNLFSEKVRFLNAYLVDDKKALIPSPKGFYEGKSGDGKLTNVVVTGEVKDGMKRASLGTYSYIEGEVMTYYNVDLASDMRNKIMIENSQESQNIFRYEYVKEGYTFVTYIAIEEERLTGLIKDAIGDEFIIGNSRSTGLGKCKVVDVTECESIPYIEYAVNEDIEDVAYLMLLSDMTMRDAFGEYCGLNVEYLEKELGVSNLKIDTCSTSTVNIRGYNRTIGSKSASITMYEKGSVFKLSFSGKLSIEKINELQNKGLGVRKNEGFGRIIFLKDYEAIKLKKEGKYQTESINNNDIQKEDEEVLKVVAKNNYRDVIDKAIIKTVVSNPLPKGTLSASQVGALESRIIANRYDYQKAVKAIYDYYNHAQKKEEASKVQKNRNSIKQLREFAIGVLNSNIEEVLDIEHKDKILGISVNDLLTEEELGRYKLQYLLEAIHYDNRKGNK